VTYAAKKDFLRDFHIFKLSSADEGTERGIEVFSSPNLIVLYFLGVLCGSFYNTSFEVRVRT
jgi:hypothetical protein